MSEQAKSNIDQDAEPTVGFRSVPLWLIALMMVLFFCVAMGFDIRGGWFQPDVYAPYQSVEELAHYQPLKSGDNRARGKILFEGNCALCHGTDGMGKPGQAPPMAGSEWVLAPGVNRLVRIPSAGLNGVITVKGQQYSLAGMAAMGATYNHDDLAAVLSYIRTAWGNNASLVTGDQVASVRAEMAGRSQPYSPEELMKLPEKEK